MERAPVKRVVVVRTIKLFFVVPVGNVVDWTYVTARTYYEPVGFDITDTYYLELSLKTTRVIPIFRKSKRVHL